MAVLLFLGLTRGIPVADPDDGSNKPILLSQYHHQTKVERNPKYSHFSYSTLLGYPAALAGQSKEKEPKQLTSSPGDILNIINSIESSILKSETIYRLSHESGWICLPMAHIPSASQLVF